MDEAHFRDLRGAIAEGQVLAIVGAGVSIAATNGAPTASWVGLLKDGVRFVEEQHARSVPEGWGDRQRAAIDTWDTVELLAVAEQIERRLGAPRSGDFRRWLRESVGALPLADPAPIEALRGLGVPLATTNYDDLIERATGLDPITRVEDHEVGRFLRREGEGGVLHLHGYWKRSETIVLGVRSYEDVLRDKLTQAAQQALAATRTLLFVGFGGGLADPNFGALLAWLRGRFAGQEHRHYRLVREKDVAAVQAQHHPDERITVVAYGEGFDDLVPCLEGLAPAAKPRHRRRNPEAPPVEPLPAKGRCIGRDAIVEDLVATLLADAPPPVPVLGGPGFGKSTVCRAALHDPRVAARYGERRFFVRLDGATTAEEMAAAVAHVLGLEVGPAAAARALAALAGAPAALVLDNAETPLRVPHPRPAEEMLCRFAEIPGVALMATIRGTAYPPGVAWRDPVEVKPLTDAYDREMFLDIAGRRLADDPRLDGLLRGLDRWPLAIELAARAAQGQRSLELVWRRWERERARMLKDGAGDDRLLSLAVSVELSIGGPTMDADARRLLSLLALLPDGLAFDDLGALLSDGGERAAATLLQAALAFEDGLRVRMLAPLREHVAAEHPPSAEDSARLVEHYTALALELGPKAGWPGGAEAVSRLAAEVANVEVALRRSVMGIDPRRAAAAAVGFGQFQRYSGLGTEGPLRAAAAAMRDAGDALGEAECIAKLGEVALYRSEHDEARRRYGEALPLFRRVGAVLGEAKCIFRLGEIAFGRSEHDEARRRFGGALPLFRRVGDVLGEANCIRGLGDIALVRSEHDEARRRFGEALPLYRRVGDMLGEANCIRSLGDIALYRSEYDEARAHYGEALPLFRRVGSVRGEAICIKGRGDVALACSKHDKARRRYGEALPLFRRVGDVHGEATCIEGFGDVALARSEHDEARRRFGEALPLYRRVGAMLGEANCILSLGDIALARSEHDEARRCYDEALTLYTRMPDPYSIGMTHRRLARIAAGDDERRRHVAAAREAWLGIKRDDLVRELDEEFGAGA